MKGRILISLKQVTVRFDDIIALADVNLDIPEGCSLAVIGPNGGGKTTLLKLIAGLIKPDSGKVTYHGLSRTHIGYVPQEITADDSFPVSALDVVLMGRYPLLGIIRRPGKRDRQIASTMLDRVGLAALAKRHMGSLSGGQKQRVAIARALASEPKLLLLDEPTSGADVEAKDKFYTLIRNLKEELDLSVVIASHELQVAPRFVDDVACVAGEVHLHACPADVWDEAHFQRIYGEQMEAVFHGEVPHRMVSPHEGTTSPRGDPDNTPKSETSSPSEDPTGNTPKSFRKKKED